MTATATRISTNSHQKIWRGTKPVEHCVKRTKTARENWPVGPGSMSRTALMLSSCCSHSTERASRLAVMAHSDCHSRYEAPQVTGCTLNCWTNRSSE